jgi:signal transduction histidine kinase
MSDVKKTKKELLEELVRLRQWVAQRQSVEHPFLVSCVEEERLLKLGPTLHRVRDEVWRMRHTDDIEKVLEEVGNCLEAMEVPFLFCGVNIVDGRVEPPVVTAYSMRQKGVPEKKWREVGGDTIVQFWRGAVPVYRRDLHKEDLYGESPHIPFMRAVVDVPFSHGTLAVSSSHPEVFSMGDLEILQNMAVVLSKGFRRLEDLQALERRNQELELEITQRRRAQEQLQKSLSELEQANVDLQQAQAQLVQSARMAALGDLVAGITHELNTPVRAISSMCDTVARASSKLEQGLAAMLPQGHEQGRTVRASLRVIADAGQVISSGAERVSEIVYSLRNFIRLDEGEFQMADLHEGLESTLVLLGPRLEDRIAVVRAYGDIEPTYCAPGQLNQVFMHLLTTSVQAIEGEGEIRIATGRQAGSVYVQICDTGAGMPPDQLDRLFEFGFESREDRIKMELG